MNKLPILRAVTLTLPLAASLAPATQAQAAAKARKTEVTIVGDKFLVNGKPTYPGRVWTTAKEDSFPVEAS